jgi:flavodoxin
MSRILVAYYSRSGSTRIVAQDLAAALEAEIEELRDHVDRSGYLGYLRTGLEGLIGAATELERPAKDPGRYDLVVVASPVFAAAVSAPVRTYLWLERERLPRVAFLVTYGGAGSDRALGQMALVAAKTPIATLALREKEVAAGEHTAQVASFAATLCAAVTSPTAAAAS